MPAYDREQFEPPAPIALVILRNPSDGTAQSDVPMLIDSGADVSLLPVRVVEELGLKGDGEHLYELVGFDESRSVSPAVNAALALLGRTFTGRFLLTDSQWGILGRNILNYLPILLNGPKLEWQLDDR